MRAVTDDQSDHFAVQIQSPRLIRKLKSRQWLRKRLLAGFELFGRYLQFQTRLSQSFASRVQGLPVY